MKKYLTVFFALNIFAFCLAVNGYASALDDMKKAQASSKAAEQASENVNSNNIAVSQNALEQTRKQGSQNFDTKNIATSSATSTPKTTTSNTASKTTIGTIVPHNSSPKLKLKSKPVPLVPTSVNTQTTQTQTQKQTTQSTQQNTAVKQATQTQPSATVTSTAAQTKTATVTNTAAQTKTATAKQTQPSTATPSTQNNTLKAPPKAKLSVKQRPDTTSLVQSNQFKKDMTKPKAVKPEKYGKKKKVHLKDFEPERHGASIVTPDQIPEGTNITAEEAKVMYKWLSAEERQTYDEETKRNLAIARDKWYKYWQDLTKKQNERRKKFNSGKFTRPQTMPNKQWTNNPVNNSLLNRVGGATAANSYTVNKINFRLPKPKLITPQLLNQAKKRYYKQKQDMEDYEKRVKQEEREKAAKQAAAEEQNKLANAEWNQICDPKVKNISDTFCSLCCAHPNTRINGYNPKIHENMRGYINSQTNSCYCQWDNKQTTDYDNRNSSDQACNGYCLAHPNDIKGFNPAKHQMHYGKLKKGQCRCYWIDKNTDICSKPTVVQSDEACAACCLQHNDTRWNVSFDPALHNMVGGEVYNKVIKSMRGCECLYVTKPGMENHPLATATGKLVAPRVPDYWDDKLMRNTCDTFKVNQSQAQCSKCCVMYPPDAPASGYVLDYGFINNGQCRCHFKNTNKVDVCDNDAKLESDYACFECCKAKPPANFDPSVSEMNYGRVEGNDCRCYWKTKYQEPAQDERESCSWETMNRSQSDCDRCCKDPSHGLVGGELESDGICVCLHS